MTAPATVTVEIACSTRADGPRIHVQGEGWEEVMSQIAAGFELEAGWGDRTPIEVVCEAHKKVRSIGGIVDTFDAKPVGQAAPIGGGPGEPADAGRVRDLIGAAPSIPELKRVWVEHRSAFDTAPDLLEAYKARGRALQSA